MRIVCEQCQTKYIVPDEKIEKNVLRMTCQKCGHVITARVEKVAETAEGSSGTLGKWKTTPLNTPRRVQNETPTWYYSYNGESFGPYTEQELKERFLSEKVLPIAEQCFVWHKTLTSWKPVLEVEPFASAILMPPPPPPPVAKAAPKTQDESMPPLFSAGKLPTLGGLSTGSKSSPDLVGLKQRLQMTSPAAKANTSSLFGKVEGNAGEQNEVPTHTQIPAVDGMDEVEEAGEATRVGSPSPFFSFQSLDAISPDIKAESKGSVSPLSRPFPSMSTPASTSASTAKPAFGGSANPVPGISSLFGSKPAANNGAPRFAGLRSMSSQSDSRLPSAASDKKVINAASALSSKNTEVTTLAKSDNLENDLPDFKEDIGAIVNDSPAPYVAKNEADGARNDSISSWLPSQSNLRIDSKLDGFSVSDISMAQNFLDNASAKDSLPSLELGNLAQKLADPEQTAVKKADLSDLSLAVPDIDMEESNSSKLSTGQASVAAKSEDSASSDILPDIDLEESNLGAADVAAVSDSIESIALDDSKSADSFAAADSLSSDVLPDIDMDDDDSQLIIPDVVEEAIERVSEVEHADDEEEQKMGSAIDLLSSIKKSSSVLNPVSDTSSASELSSIDLDSDSQFASEHLIETVSAGGSELTSSGNPDFDALFEPSAEESSIAKARSSHATLDEIAARHAALFAESERLEKENASENESGVSESSMLIQLEHFQKAQQKDKRKNYVRILLIALIVVAICALIGTFGYIATSEDKTVEEQTSFAKVSGDKVSEEELQIVVPEDDFEILDMKPTKSKSRGSRGNADSERGSVANLGGTDAAAAAIYGDTADAPETDEAKEPAKPAVRADGRSAVVLQNNNDNFANVAGVQGSKYATKGTSRDLFAGGLKRVSSSVQDCSRRTVNKGFSMPPKIYLNLVIQPDGSVSTYEIQDAEVPEMFKNCLPGKKDTWKFTPFEGEPVKIKQAFILG